MKIPEKQNSIEKMIDEAMTEKNKPRPYLGCSIIGHPCDRFLFQSFRWFYPEIISGRLARIFRRGNEEEKTVIDDLRKIGMIIESAQNQKEIDFFKMVRGHLDGVITSGVPGAKSKRHVLEIKTHNEKSFRELQKKGVEEAKSQHYIQMQLYMAGASIDRALYVAVNKNTDEYYTERVRYNDSIAQYHIERALHIVTLSRVPERLSNNPSWYQCKFCNHYEGCHGSEPIQKNCRTCENLFLEDDRFRCTKYNYACNYNEQLRGCQSWKLIT